MGCGIYPSCQWVKRTVPGELTLPDITTFCQVYKRARGEVSEYPEFGLARYFESIGIRKRMGPKPLMF